MQDNKILVIEDLHYSYMHDWLFSKTPALRGISFDVARGEAFGFLGPNGAGKTTTIKCILSLINVRKGRITIDGKDSRKSESRKVVGFLPEQPYFYDHLTAHELVEMYALLAGLKPKEAKKTASEALNKTKVLSRSKSPLRSLSKGLLQRVGIAQAIVASPKLLILDEPFSGLDPVGRREIRELLSLLKEDGTSIFMSSHILSDVAAICDRASILVKGAIRGIYTLSDTKCKEMLEDIFMEHVNESGESVE